MDPLFGAANNEIVFWEGSFSNSANEKHSIEKAANPGPAF
jgi:hypothetical protein